MEVILRSREFGRAEYLCRFLRCCVEQALDGHFSQLKEYWLGRSVFQRDQTFDPSVDPIVRVQARRLRQKLEHYYENEGRQDPVRILLPVGTYVPQFSRGGGLDLPAVPRRKSLSLAVLPFAGLGQDGACALLAAELTDELIHHIVETGKFLVVSRLSSSRYQAVGDDVQTIGKALRADLLVEGRVRASEGGHVVCVQLTDAATGYHLWSASFEHPHSSTTHGGGEIARRITGLLENGHSGFVSHVGGSHSDSLP